MDSRPSSGLEIDISDFYGRDSIAAWQAVLGKDLHYHFGHFHSYDDDFQSALQAAVRLFFHFIPEQASVLDLGCGWGGPARLLELEKRSTVTCVSNTPEQVDYLQSILGRTDVVQMDLENGIQEGHWDVALMMESLEHVSNKEALIASLNNKVKTLLIRINATALVQRDGLFDFGGSMQMVTPATLKGILTRQGWHVQYAMDSRRASWPTLLYWREALGRQFQGDPPPGHFSALKALCDRGIVQKERWIRHNPLLNIVAVRA